MLFLNTQTIKKSRVKQWTENLNLHPQFITVSFVDNTVTELPDIHLFTRSSR